MIRPNNPRTSRQQKNPRLPLLFAGLPAGDKTSVGPRVLPGQAEDGEREGCTALRAELELLAVHLVPVVLPVGVVAPAQELDLGPADGEAEPGDGVAVEVAAAAVDGLVAEERRVENVEGVLLQGQAPTWEDGSGEPTGGGCVGGDCKDVMRGEKMLNLIP